MKGDSCLFCNIRDGKIPGYLVYEDPHVLAILDIQPRCPGHTLVIPRYHTPLLADLPKEEVGPLFQAVQTVGRKLKKALGAPGMTIGINQGEVSGQAVEHLHVHLMPRFLGDKGMAVQGVVDMPSEVSLDDMRRTVENTIP